MGHRAIAAFLVVGVGCAVLAGASAAGRRAGSDAVHQSVVKRIVLGSRTSFGPYGRGWGTPDPALLDNDGDPSGHAWNIHWTDWGTAVARGSGSTYHLEPASGGGYRIARLQLRASRIGQCYAKGPVAYTRLQARVAPLKHGKFSAWKLWNARPNLCHPAP